jgi:formylglycine-generating enzyme required for sulfatase activity
VHEVTQGQFKKVMGYNPSYFSKDGKGKQGVAYGSWKPGGGKEEVKGLGSTDDLPVEQVSWQEAQAFLKKLSERPQEMKKGRKYRLPTEAEWEYACRAGTTTAFHYGDSLSSQQANFKGSRPYGGATTGPYLGRTSQVGSYKPNAFGLHDMHGNVSEWCQDWYGEDYYKGSPRRDPAGPSKGSSRVMRGGCWGFGGEDCRSAFRFRDSPGDRSSDLGFRVALDPSGR